VRPSVIEVDLGAIRHNVKAFATLAAPARLCVVVKADAYGHGDVPVAAAAAEAGADLLAVALVSEGIGLREAGVELPILLLSEPAPTDAMELVRWRLTPTVYTETFITALEAAAPAGTGVHLKVDTGMHRVGAPFAAAPDLARRIANGPLHLEGLWTHFPVADEDAAFTATQVRALREVESRLAADGIAPDMVHAANTAAAIGDRESHLGMVRVGLGTYGLLPTPDAAIDIRPAMRVVSGVAHLARLPAGARPSYGRRRPLARESTVASVPIGYADGVPRRLFDAAGEVLIRSRRYPFAGMITMDQCVVDVGDDPVAVGDEVVLLGHQGDAEITAEEWAQRLGTIVWEVVCGFGPRLPRRYRG
jgi:alanine racemase